MPSTQIRRGAPPRPPSLLPTHPTPHLPPPRLEAGQHPYWLVESTRHPYRAPKGLKDATGTTIPQGVWVVSVHWYICTSEDPNHKAYRKLVEESAVQAAEREAADAAQPNAPPSFVAHLKMSAFVTEVDIQWAHYSSRLGTGVLSDDSHLRLMRHNYSNVTS